MEEYIKNKNNVFDERLVSLIDELPLWSAPFGMKLLEKLKINKNLNVIDIGCGTGFPFIEIAQRLGAASRVFGADPWKGALMMAQSKINAYNIVNAFPFCCYAENLPFKDSSIDIIVSNNGINNVADISKTIAECGRICRSGSQFIFTMNLDKSMLEFYAVLKEELVLRNDPESVNRLKRHIYEKRRPLEEIKSILNENSFQVEEEEHDIFYLRFADAEAMFEHSFIKYWFLGNWHKIVDEASRDEVFDIVKVKLNKIAEEKRELKLSIPFAVVSCIKL